LVGSVWNQCPQPANETIPADKQSAKTSLKRIKLKQDPGTVFGEPAVWVRMLGSNGSRRRRGSAQMPGFPGGASRLDKSRALAEREERTGIVD
jgi:hypothetical protein